jgi:hypothetical protein
LAIEPRGRRDPLIRTVMAADNIDPTKLAALLRRWQCALFLRHHRHQARNHCRRTLGIAAHRPYLFQ